MLRHFLRRAPAGCSIATPDPRSGLGSGGVRTDASGRRRRSCSCGPRKGERTCAVRPMDREARGGIREGGLGGPRVLARASRPEARISTGASAGPVRKRGRRWCRPDRSDRVIRFDARPWWCEAGTRDEPVREPAGARSERPRRCGTRHRTRASRKTSHFRGGTIPAGIRAPKARNHRSERLELIGWGVNVSGPEIRPEAIFGECDSQHD